MKMTVTIEKDHPFFFVKELLHGCDRPLLLEFSRYVYQPRSVSDRREIVTVHCDDLTEEWVNDQLSALPANMELAFHSRLYVDGRELHLPLVDFGRRFSSSASAAGFQAAELMGQPLQFFNSGRSKHGYGQSLLEKDGWIRFMGRLLLLNIPECPELIDSRWIGHRLLAGYGALRWSANTPHYLQIPRLAA